MLGRLLAKDPALPYLVPIFGFALGTALEARLPPAWYPVAYVLKVLVVTALAWAARAAWIDLAPPPSAAALAVASLAGLAVTALWVGLDGHYPRFGFLGDRAGFDPDLLPPVPRILFLAFRLFGLVALIPLIEELLWRSFVMRWVQDPDFTRVPPGKVTLAAAVVTALGFALTHGEWLPALLTGLLWAGLVHRTRSVAVAVWSHAVANLALFAYVLVTGAYRFW